MNTYSSINETATMGMARPAIKAIPAELQRLHATIEELSQMLKDLNNSLAPVARTEIEPPMMVTDKIRSTPGPAVAEELRAASDRLGSLVLRVKDLMDRIEL